MKKIFLTIGIVLSFAFLSLAQKYAFVDTEYIMDNIPAFKAAQEQLDQVSAQYQKELVENFIYLTMHNLL